MSRKQIRQPDTFITLSQRAYKLAREHRTPIILIVGSALAVLLGVIGWQAYVHQQDSLAAVEFNRGLSLYRSGKYGEAVSAFERVTAYRHSHFYPLALLYETNGYLAQKDPDKAIAVGRRLITSGRGDPLITQSGLISVAYAEEQKGLCKDAIEHYTEAEKIQYSDAKQIPAPLRDTAVLGKARCSVQLGDVKGAIAAYREYLKDADREVASYVSLKIAELEAKAGGSQGNKGDGGNVR